jgi:hypothetical protein
MKSATRAFGGGSPEFLGRWRCIQIKGGSCGGAPSSCGATLGGGEAMAWPFGCEAARWLATEPSWTRSVSFGPHLGLGGAGLGTAVPPPGVEGGLSWGRWGWRRTFLSVAAGASRASGLMGSGLRRARRA